MLHISDTQSFPLYETRRPRHPLKQAKMEYAKLQ
jgi:hypothetical protein